MVRNTLSVIALFTFLASSNLFAQAGHTVQVDDGIGNYSILKGSNPGGTFFLPAGPGSFTLLTSSSGWAVGGNSNPSSSILGTNTGHNLDIRTSGAPRLMVLSGGNVGVGTITPSALFSVGAGASSPFQVDNGGNVKTSGGTQLGYVDVASGSSPAAPLATTIMQILDNAVAASQATITLPAGAANGSIVVLATNDPDGAKELTTGYSFSNTVSVRFVKFTAGWRPEF